MYYRYTFNKRGNRTAEIGKKASRSYVYDETNRMVEGTNWKGDKSAYTYNGLGLRINNTQTTHAGKVYTRDYVIDYTSFENDDLMVYAEGNGQLEYEQKHVYAGSERIEQFTDKGNWERTLYVHEDVMGNTRYYTKANGQSFAELTYDAWGMPESPNKLLSNDHGNYVFATFTGHIYDTTLDIYFAEARFYDANNRTWLAMDPVKDGLNWYQYCYSNPTTYWDLLGLKGAAVTGGGLTAAETIARRGAQSAFNRMECTKGKSNEILSPTIVRELKILSSLSIWDPYAEGIGRVLSLFFGQGGNLEDVYADILEERLKELREKLIISNKYLSLTQMEPNAIYIRERLKIAGWTDNAIYALFGNIQTESNFNPGLWQSEYEDPGRTHGVGLTQWSPGGKKIIDWANQQGLDPYDIDVQLYRLQLEVLSEEKVYAEQWNARDEFNNMSFQEFTESEESVTKLAEIFFKCYEKNGRDKETPTRQEQAIYWRDFFEGKN